MDQGSRQGRADGPARPHRPPRGGSQTLELQVTIKTIYNRASERLVRAYERAKGYVALRIALASQWLPERLRETSRRTYTGWLFVAVFLALPYVVLGGLWEHLRNAAERLWDDVSDIEWAAFTPSYWREHIKQ
ncbi:hypothetical protein SMSKK35_4394 [Stenotrophomonas maltophilia SKK35]|nr:hypothetical protein SMSKK35_4394 [Stenotrophomonas maltophilia SKK35]